MIACSEQSTCNLNHERFYVLTIKKLTPLNQDSIINLLKTYYNENVDSHTDTDIAIYNKVLGRSCLKKRDYYGGIKCLTISDSLFSNQKEYKHLTETSVFLINSYARVSMLDKALDVAHKAEAIAKEHNPKALSNIYGEIARIYYYLEKASDQAVRYLKLASENAIEYKDTLFHANLNFRLSTVYTEKNMIDTSLVYLNKAIKVLKNHPNSVLLPYIYTEKGSCYSKKGKNKEALVFYKKSTELLRKNKLPIYSNLYNIGKFYHAQGALDSALYYYKATLYNASRVELNKKLKTIVENTFKDISDIYLRRNKPYIALQAYKDYIQSREKVYEADMKSKLVELETKYQAQKKQATIDKLQRDMEHRKQVQIRNIIIIVALLLVIIFVSIFFVYYSRSRNMERTQEKFMLEQRLLRSQMNPHFILNTFTTIQSFISAAKIELAERYLVKFSRLLRLSLDNSIEEYVSLEDELDAITNYLELQKMRFDRKFEYNINIDENLDTYDLVIPPMLIQPFIENSIEHGFKGVKQGGLINVNITERDNSIYCVIEDNGCGLNGKIEKRKNSSKPSHSINITKRRFTLLGDKQNSDFRVNVVDRFISEGVRGVSVRLLIPVKK